MLVSGPESLVHTTASKGKEIHGIGVDAITLRRYSVPILGKYLVIIANPPKYPTHEQFPVLLSRKSLASQHNSIMTSVHPDLTGGHFFA